MTPPDSQSRPNGVLAGLKVLDLSTLLAGPFAGALLADFGAQVIKVEDPARGDPTRGFPPMLDGVSLGSKVTNRGKECITLDLRSRAGQEILRRLAAHRDIVITNFRPATLRKWRLDHDVFSRGNPGLIMLHITGFGRTGPYADRPGFARVAEAFFRTHGDHWPARRPADAHRLSDCRRHHRRVRRARRAAGSA